ncbi:Arc family DNA-binding protein [Acinetobacter guerrae]|uniref:Arc family DNA-binding protein n=1 Tax=Acinetobacter guerrae TaxID=1843371 RepID=A0A3A8EM32_9GAMM|nr:Arc family DNA-binding protein [Acinetobacter guerrae]RKG35189.1 Arc family DNA-binding protein [Acinetobacter guerrae]
MESRDTGTQHKLRMPPELKEKLFSSAKSMNRSLNAEIVARLETTFENDDHIQDLTDRVKWLEKNLLKVMQELRMYDPNKRD